MELFVSLSWFTALVSLSDTSFSLAVLQRCPYAWVCSAIGMANFLELTGFQSIVFFKLDFIKYSNTYKSEPFTHKKVYHIYKRFNFLLIICLGILFVCLKCQSYTFFFYTVSNLGYTLCDDFFIICTCFKKNNNLKYTFP